MANGLLAGGGSLACLCPFHRKNTPSYIITPSKNLYHCFGCNAGGSVLDWLQHTERLTSPQTLVRLRELAGTSSPAAAVPPAPPRPKLADLDDDGQALLGQVVDFYPQPAGVQQPRLRSGERFLEKGQRGGNMQTGIAAVPLSCWRRW